MTSRNSPIVDGARSALESLKMETARELGIQNYDSLDKGSIPSKVHGAVGGQMTRKLIALAKSRLSGSGY